MLSPAIINCLVTQTISAMLRLEIGRHSPELGPMAIASTDAPLSTASPHCMVSMPPLQPFQLPFQAMGWNLQSYQMTSLREQQREPLLLPKMNGWRWQG